MKNEPIEVLRKFFAISTAAFEFQQAIIQAVGGKPFQSYMQTLHIQAQTELSKQAPNMELIDNLLSEMEKEAERNSKK